MKKMSFLFLFVLIYFPAFLAQAADPIVIDNAQQTAADSVVTLINLLIAMFGASSIGVKAVALLTAAVAVIGSCSVIVKTLEMLAKLTPTKTDDEYVGVLAKYFNLLIYVLSKLALNTPAKTKEGELK